jgi:hypothetical protein
MALEIDYESRSFPVPGPVVNGVRTLTTTWDDLLWAAITIGRPDWFHVIRYGNASFYEALFRWSMLRMALEQIGPTARRLRRTAAAKHLDPSEKGAINYFVGMIICKLFASELLGAPWMLHVDIFRAQLGVMLTGRSRPDLIGQIHGTNDWIVMESKGRISAPSPRAKSLAKAQSRRITSIAGVAPTYHIGAISYLRSDVLTFFWEDPMDPDEQRRPSKFEIGDVSPDVWRFYYQPALACARELNGTPISGIDENAFGQYPDLKLTIHPAIMKAIASEEWALARRLCVEMSNELTAEGYHPDGISVKAGVSWSSRFVEAPGV